MPETLALARAVEREQMPHRNANRLVFYEQPLSERIRAFLRLEFLLGRADFQLRTDDPWSSRGAMESIIDILAVMSRSDLKKELLKELERQCATIEALASNPNVDERRLESILERVRRVRGTLYQGENIPGSRTAGTMSSSAWSASAAASRPAPAHSTSRATTTGCSARPTIACRICAIGCQNSIASGRRLNSACNWYGRAPVRPVKSHTVASTRKPSKRRPIVK